MKKNRLKTVTQSLILLLAVVCSSCLRGDLVDLPAFEDAEITDVKFDFRYKDVTDEWINGEPVVKVVGLTVENKKIDSASGTITCSLAVPAASGPFTEAIRNTVTLSSVVGKCNLSTAAVIEPNEGSPILGTPGDFTSARKYTVTAANGKQKEWTIQVTALNK